jgi:hypothetical protein
MSSDDPRLVRADELRLTLHTKTGMSFRQADLLSDYRQWLDAHGIEAEMPDGWPSAEVYLDGNINAFLADYGVDHA